DIRHVEVRSVVEVREVRDLGTIRRPLRRADGGALRRLDRSRLPGGGVDDLEAGRAARGKRAHAVRLRVHLKTAEVVVELPVLLHARHPFALELEEMLAVGALIAEGDVQMPRCRYDLLDRGGWSYVGLLGEQLLERPLLGDLLRDRRNGYREGGKDESGGCDRPVESRHRRAR